MVAEPFGATHSVIAALVVALLILLPGTTHGNHHHQFDGRGIALDYVDLASPYVMDEPNSASETSSRRDLRWEAEEAEDLAGFGEMESAYSEALVVYEDYMETIFESCGCAWNSQCCRMGWIGTIDRWIGTTPAGIWDPEVALELVASRMGTSTLAASRIGTSTLVRLASSLHEALWSSMRWLVACAWTSMCTFRSLSMTWFSCWPMTSGALFLLFFVIILKKLNYKRKRRQRLVQSHLGQCRCPYRKPRRWNGHLQARWNAYMKLKGCIFLLMYTQTMAMDAAQANDLLSRIMELSTAATTAANTANTMLETFTSNGGRNSQPRFGDGAKVLRSHDTFDTDDPVKYTMWREQFLNWLTFCDNRYAELIQDVEQLETMTTLGSLDEDVKDLARKLYSILSSYLQGPALQIVRANSGDRNGFAVWHRLKELYAPRARPRALAIGQAIMQHPSFSQQRSMLENLLQFDALLDQYELAAGHRMPDDLTVSTVLRCLDGGTRRHLEMIMDDTMDYAKLKDKLILLDKNTKAWSGDNFLKNLQLMNQPTSSSSSTYQGSAPMEIDQVQFGQKGKNKGKSGQKGKKGSWFGFPYGGRGGGSKGCRKGKSKSKGKKGNKGKDKGKQHKGKGYSGGGSGRNQCRICGQYGHWGNECPMKGGNVNQVNNAGGNGGGDQLPVDVASTTGSTSTRRTSSTSMTSQATASGTKSVRLVKMYHVATPPAEHPETFDLRSDLEDDEYSVRMVSLQTPTMWYKMDLEDGDPGGDHVWASDPLMDWYHGVSTTLDWSQGESDGMENLEKYHIRMVPATDQLVVLDSGADISLLPYHLSGCGIEKHGGHAVLEDAQGERLKTFGRRSARVECEGLNNDLVVIEDDFIVASVQSPLISLGRLLHRGWTLSPGNSSDAKVNLVSPDGAAAIPLQFKRNSLAVLASIRVVSARDVAEPSSTSTKRTSHGGEQHYGMVDEDKDMMVVQTVIKPRDELLQRVFRRGWAVSSTGNPFIIMPASNRYLNPGISYSRDEWPLRSTAFQHDDLSWELVETCNQYYLDEEIEDEIPGCHKPTLVLTMLHKKEESTDVLGAVCGQELVEAGGTEVNLDGFGFAEEPGVPAELLEGHKPEELMQVDSQPAGSKEVPEFVWEFENKDSLVINGTTITVESSVVLLRAAASVLGVNQGGSKKSLWHRINQRAQILEHEESFVTANKLYMEQQWKKGLVGQSVPREPTEEEVKQHELAHLPFQPWCPYCVSCKSKQDPQRPVEHQEEERRSIPSIQLDYCFSKADGSDYLNTILVAIDCQTKMVSVHPVPSKGANLRGQAEHLVRFSMALNYMDRVEFVSDAEPTMKSLLASVQLMRQHLGYPTVVTHSRPGDKGRTAQVERVIQTLRRQSSTLVQMASDRCSLQLPGDHAIWPWSFVHAAWTLNRFVNHTTTQMSPFELVYGRRYSGKVACFGEMVLVLHRRGLNTKLGPQWVPGIWLTKTDGDDLHVVATDALVTLGEQHGSSC